MWGDRVDLLRGGGLEWGDFEQTLEGEVEAWGEADPRLAAGLVELLLLRQMNSENLVLGELLLHRQSNLKSVDLVPILWAALANAVGGLPSFFLGLP